MKRALVLLGLLTLAGCAYYNGMYNAKRMAGRARKAEREGRTLEAATLWSQAGVKAESVLAQHPDSRWADEARLIQGTAMVRVRDCASAVRPLERVAFTSPNSTFREEATILLGGCRTQLGDPSGAMEAYSRLTGSRDPARRRLARFAHGQAQRMEGNYQQAFEELSGTDYPGAAGERAAALAGLGRLNEAGALADSLLAAHDTLVPWEALVEAFGRHDRESASALTDRLVNDTSLALHLRGRLLLTDAIRWRGDSLERSDARLAQLTRLAAGRPQTAEARLEALRFLGGEVETLPELTNWIDQVEELSEGTGQVAPQAARLAAIAHRVALTADSVTPGAVGGDLRLFLAGELARDSLETPRFAVRQFERVAAEWPESPFTPKALLALVLLQPAQADSLRDLLRTRYGASPYVLLIETGTSPEYEALEDSLRRFALTYRPEGLRPAGPPVRTDDRRPPSTSPREPVNR